MVSIGRGGFGNRVQHSDNSSYTQDISTVETVASAATCITLSQTVSVGRGGYGNNLFSSQVYSSSTDEYLERVQSASSPLKRCTIGRGGWGNQQPNKRLQRFSDSKHTMLYCFSNQASYSTLG